MNPDNPATTTDCQYLSYLSPEAQTLMGKRATTSTLVEDDKVYQAIYLTKISKTTDKELAVSELAELINTLVSYGLVHSTIAPLNTIDLYHGPGRHSAIVAHAFVLVPASRLADAEVLAAGYSFPEGMIGDTACLNLDLPRGQFYCNFGISMAQTVVKGFDMEAATAEQVEDILRLLPKDTSLVNLRVCPVFSTTPQYEAIFQNELLADIKEVMIAYVNRFVEIDGMLKSVKLPVHIRYISREGHNSIL
jgi:hypothetical protein